MVSTKGWGYVWEYDQGGGDTDMEVIRGSGVVPTGDLVNDLGVR